MCLKFVKIDVWSKVERQKMLFIKRIVILDLHETIGHFH